MALFHVSANNQWYEKHGAHTAASLRSLIGIPIVLVIFANRGSNLDYGFAAGSTRVGGCEEDAQSSSRKVVSRPVQMDALVKSLKRSPDNVLVNFKSVRSDHSRDVWIPLVQAATRANIVVYRKLKVELGPTLSHHTY